jgi:hypothetical protein
VRSTAIALAVLGGLGAFGITEPTYSECHSSPITALDQGRCHRAATFPALRLMAFIVYIDVVVVSLIYWAVKGAEPGTAPGHVAEAVRAASAAALPAGMARTEHGDP